MFCNSICHSKKWKQPTCPTNPTDQKCSPPSQCRIADSCYSMEEPLDTLSPAENKPATQAIYSDSTYRKRPQQGNS